MRVSPRSWGSKPLAFCRVPGVHIWRFLANGLRVSAIHPPQKGGRVNKTELIDALATDVNLSKADAGRAVEALFGDSGVLAREMKAGGRVQITGFGTFQAKKRAAREGRDPRTGATIQIKAATLPAFKAGQALKDALNS